MRRQERRLCDSGGWPPLPQLAQEVLLASVPGGCAAFFSSRFSAAEARPSPAPAARVHSPQPAPVARPGNGRLQQQASGRFEVETGPLRDENPQREAAASLRCTATRDCE